MHTSTTSTANDCQNLTPVRSVTITRAEGFEEELITRAFQGPRAWGLAATELRRWARTAPEGGCYDKCDFEVLWEDGTSYRGRYDLQRGSDGNLGVQIRGFLAWVIEGRLGAEKAGAAQHLLDTADLGAW
jgi:hypothetical protein